MNRADEQRENELIVALMRHATARTPKQRAEAWAEVLRLKQPTTPPKKDA